MTWSSDVLLVPPPEQCLLELYPWRSLQAHQEAQWCSPVTGELRSLPVLGGYSTAARPPLCFWGVTPQLQFHTLKELWCVHALDFSGVLSRVPGCFQWGREHFAGSLHPIYYASWGSCIVLVIQQASDQCLWDGADFNGL